MTELTFTEQLALEREVGIKGLPNHKGDDAMNLNLEYIADASHHHYVRMEDFSGFVGSITQENPDAPWRVYCELLGMRFWEYDTHLEALKAVERHNGRRIWCVGFRWPEELRPLPMDVMTEIHGRSGDMSMFRKPSTEA